MKLRSLTAFFILLHCLIFYIYSQDSNERPLKVGLFVFSTSVFDEQRDKMGKQYENLEQILIDKFNIQEEHFFPNVEISYDDMEGPVNIIDDSMTSGVMGKLEKYRRLKKLDGIIFGHIQQESEMIIVFRLYFSKEAAKLPGIRETRKRNRIASFRRNIPINELTTNNFNRVTEELIGKLDTLITGRTTTPTPTTDTSTHTPPIPTPPTQSVIPLTLEDVYLIINKHGFYFEKNLKTGHEGALNSLCSKQKIEKDEHSNYIFKYNRDLESSTVPGKPGIMKTISKNKEDVTDVITLYWAKDQVKKIRYKDALEKIKELNEENYGGFSNWRIPTIKELFSIVAHLPNHDFFPFALDIEDMSDDPQSWEIKLWTSTPVTEEVKNYISETCHSPDRAYFILENRRTQTEYNLTFHIGCEKYRLYVLPVRSEGETITAPSVSDRTRKDETSPGDKLYMCTIPFFDISGRSTDRGKIFVKEITNALIKEVKREFGEGGKEIIVDDPAFKIPGQEWVNLKKILFDSPRLNDREKREKVVEKFMKRDRADVIITGKYVEIGEDEEIQVWLRVIRKSPQKMLKGHFHFSFNDLLETHDGTTVSYTLKQKAADNISQIFRPPREAPTGEVKKTETVAPVEAREPVRPTPTQLEPLFATQLSFISATGKRLKPMPLKEIDIIWGTFSSILREELKKIQKEWGKKLEVNAKGHRIPDKKDKIDSLIEIIYDEFMPIKNKIDKIIDTKMKPKNVDIIITGQYVFRPPNEKITIRPIVVVKSAKKLLMKNILFNKSELVYRPAYGKRKLTEGAKDIIREKVIDFLREIHE